METIDFKKGMPVRHIPPHVNGDENHSDCENGIVSSINDKWVFVKYDNLCCNMVTGDEPYTAQATSPENLIIRKKARILKDDIISRFMAGEIGILLKNDFDKYDYFVQLPPVMLNGEEIHRSYYFYKDEVELINE